MRKLVVAVLTLAAGGAWAAPEWLGTKAGVSGKVVAPFTGVRAGGSRVSCWERTYDFAGQAFPTKITAKGKQVLAGPVELVGIAAGEKLTWRSGSGRLERANQLEACWRGVGAGGGGGAGGDDADGV